VPSNLDIYGTMNTADRSVEALDTALRRRFEFKEMMPDYSVIEDETVEDIKLSKVLKTINERIELLVDRDHTIGHSYFVNVNTTKGLANAFNNKIVPLLQEYFYGDYGKIGLVLGKGFVDKKENKEIRFADFKYENSEDFKTPTFVLKQLDSATVVEAVNLLLGKKEEKETE
jgi:5-methylcytosine-specific restriction endonuclease McrBC GTP-binding regulatory subunit McrB